ncbi:MAG: hypothetical protein R3F59_11370 [Myxococcota bacterium]
MTNGGNYVLVWLTGGIGSCLGVVVLLYNAVAAVLFSREETEGRASSLSITCWAIGVLAMLLWWLPCVGGAAGLFSMVVGYFERGRIYRDQSSLASATPVRMGISNGALAVVLHSVLMLVMLVSWLFG